MWGHVNVHQLYAHNSSFLSSVHVHNIAWFSAFPCSQFISHFVKEDCPILVPLVIARPLQCSHLSASMATLACSLEACWVTAWGHPRGGTWEGSCPEVHRPCWVWPGAEGPMAQLTWGGEVAMEAMGLLPLKLSEALRRENMASASGKLGGVAGVLAGVCIIWWWWLYGILVSWKKALNAVSNCQCAACKSCFAWSAAHPAVRTNWFIITWCFRSSIFAEAGYSKPFPLGWCSVLEVILPCISLSSHRPWRQHSPQWNPNI